VTFRCLVLLAFAGITLGGCGGGEQSSPWFPLREGAKWTFDVQIGLIKRVETLDVDSRDSVAGQAGWRLRGPGGDSRVTWKQGTLVADELAGTRYMPAIPLLSPRIAQRKKVTTPAESIPWKGTIVVGARAMNATANLRVFHDDMIVLGKKDEVLRAELTVTVGNKARVVTTWYAQGIGVYRQEETLDGNMERSLDYVKGP
jgi:hypothetical protein